MVEGCWFWTTNIVVIGTVSSHFTVTKLHRLSMKDYIKTAKLGVVPTLPIGISKIEHRIFKENETQIMIKCVEFIMSLISRFKKALSNLWLRKYHCEIWGHLISVVEIKRFERKRTVKTKGWYFLSEQLEHMDLKFPPIYKGTRDPDKICVCRNEDFVGKSIY